MGMFFTMRYGFPVSGWMLPGATTWPPTPSKESSSALWPRSTRVVAHTGSHKRGARARAEGAERGLWCPVIYCCIGGFADDKELPCWCGSCPAREILPKALAQLTWARDAEILEFHSTVPDARDLWLVRRGAGPKLYLGYIRHGKFFPSERVKELREEMRE